jgi:hypothetical protein
LDELTGQIEIKRGVHMFNTIRFCINNVQLDKQHDRERELTNNKNKQREELTHVFGEPKIEYDGKASRLYVEVSLPGFMYGHDIFMITPSNINGALNKLSSYVAERMLMSSDELPSVEEWSIDFLDVCSNFHTGESFLENLRYLHQKKIPHYKRVKQGPPWFMVWERTSDRISVVDKGIEVISKQYVADINELSKRAEGIIRIEGRFSGKEIMKRFGTQRVVDILRPPVAYQLMMEILDKLSVNKYRVNMEEAYDILMEKGFSEKTAERIAYFLQVVEDEGLQNAHQSINRSTYHRYLQILSRQDIYPSFSPFPLKAFVLPESWTVDVEQSS